MLDSDRLGALTDFAVKKLSQAGLSIPVFSCFCIPRPSSQRRVFTVSCQRPFCQGIGDASRDETNIMPSKSTSFVSASFSKNYKNLEQASREEIQIFARWRCMCQVVMP